MFLQPLEKTTATRSTFKASHSLPNHLQSPKKTGHRSFGRFLDLGESSSVSWSREGTPGVSRNGSGSKEIQRKTLCSMGFSMVFNMFSPVCPFTTKLLYCRYPLPAKWAKGQPTWSKQLWRCCHSLLYSHGCCDLVPLQTRYEHTCWKRKENRMIRSFPQFHRFSLLRDLLAMDFGSDSVVVPRRLLGLDRIVGEGLSRQPCLLYKDVSGEIPGSIYFAIEFHGISTVQESGFPVGFSM